MQVRFPRLPDGARAYSVVERSDGVRYRVHEGIAGPEIPHDLVHFVVERETGEDGGFWGAVAAGAVFDSMAHLGGRRPPHVARRSREALRERRDRLLRAELMAGLVEHVARSGTTSPAEVRAAARETLSVLPDPDVDESRVIEAARRLREVEREWRDLSVGDELVLDWPERRGRTPRSSAGDRSRRAERR